jgi:DNA topoisomerase IB
LHPNHGHDIVEWPDGSSGPRNEPPEDDEGSPLKPGKIVERRQARTLKGLTIRADATEVHVSDDPDSDVQAKYRLPNGSLEAIKSSADIDKRHLAHWAKYKRFAKAYPKLKRKLDELRKDPDSMSDEDAIIHIADQYYFRHGNRENMDARGASTLLVDDVDIDGDTVSFHFDSKSGMHTEISKTDPVTAQLLSKRMEGKAGHERIFGDTVEERTNRRLSEHLEGGFSMKWLRTHGATQIALKHLKVELASVKQGKTPLSTDKDIKALRDRVSLAVGKELGHKRRVPKSDPPEYEATGSTADRSYISPAVWDRLVKKSPASETELNKAYTPDWHDKTPEEERDIDEYAEARKRKGENRQWGIREFGGQRKPLVKTWIQSLSDQGFAAPVIKQATAQQMWFLNNGIDYVGTFGLNGDVFVEKATFKPTFNKPGISYSPSGRNRPKEEKKDIQTLNLDESDDI